MSFLFMPWVMNPLTFRSNVANLVKSPQSDSDLPDEIVFHICETTMSELYDEAPDGPMIRASTAYPHVAAIRGTASGREWASNAATGASMIANVYFGKFEQEVDECKEFLKNNPQVRHVIGHSRGHGVAIAAAYDNPNVKICGIDGAALLSSGIQSWTRNINSNSSMDGAIDPYGPAEMHHPYSNMFDDTLPASARVGHQSWRLEYRKKFKGKPGEKRLKVTGFGDGSIKYKERGSVY